MRSLSERMHFSAHNADDHIVPTNNDVTERLPLGEGSVGSARFVGNGSDDWATPFVGDPNESVRVIPRTRSVLPDEEALSEIVAEQQAEAALAAKPQPEPEPNPEPRKPAKDYVSKYGGKFANIGRSTRAQASGSVAERFSRQQEKAAEQVSPMTPVVLPARDRLTPQELEAAVDWQERIANETAVYRAAFGIAEARTVVDVGCGTGRLATLFALWGCQTTGVDDDPAMVAAADLLAAPQRDEIARQGGSLGFLQVSPGRLAETFGIESVDTAVATDVLPNLRDLDEMRNCLLDLGEVLAPNGTAVFSFRNFRKLTYLQQRSGDPRFCETAEGLRMFMDLYDYPAGGIYVDVDTLCGIRQGAGPWAMSSVRSRKLVVTSEMLARELVESGFDVVSSSGSFDGTREEPLESDVIVVTARKRRRVARVV